MFKSTILYYSQLIIFSILGFQKIIKHRFLHLCKII